jgi:hypothetical protein
MTHERVSQPLGRIAEILLESHARVSLNEIRDILFALDAEAYADGFMDGQVSAEARDNEAAEHAYRQRCEDQAPWE